MPFPNVFYSGNKSTAKIVQALESESEKLTQLQKHLNEDQPTFYYYKRWLWMMFPWVCLSYKSNYSRIIFECFSSPTKYISVTDERERTMRNSFPFFTPFLIFK